jgi:hypothetical protein
MIPPSRKKPFLAGKSAYAWGSPPCQIFRPLARNELTSKRLSVRKYVKNNTDLGSDDGRENNI